ncbi:hypothetical protein AgCh_032563 [Apium graveolens]
MNDESRSKKESKNVKGKGGGSGFTKVCSFSPELQKITGVPELAITEDVKQMWSYIRENNLQDLLDMRSIICDDALHALFNVDSINMFQMNKVLTKHIWPLDSDASVCNGGWTSDRHLAWSNKVFDTIGSDLWNDGDGFEKFAHASLELSKVYMELGFLNNSQRELFAAEIHLKNTIKQVWLPSPKVEVAPTKSVSTSLNSAGSMGSVALQVVAGPYMWNVEWFFALQHISRGTPPLGTKKTYRRKLHVYKKRNARMVESRRK